MQAMCSIHIVYCMHCVPKKNICCSRTILNAIRKCGQTNKCIFVACVETDRRRERWRYGKMNAIFTLYCHIIYLRLKAPAVLNATIWLGWECWHTLYTCIIQYLRKRMKSDSHPHNRIFKIEKIEPSSKFRLEMQNTFIWMWKLCNVYNF